MLTILGAVAQMEREQIGERTRAALAYKRERGERLGTTPLGFRTPRPRQVPVAVAAELESVRHILARRGAGVAFRAIAAELTVQCFQTKRGGRWYASTVQAVWEARRRYALT